MPASIVELADPAWAGRIGWAPTNASLQDFVTALRTLVGEDAARTWLEGIVANAVPYEGNTAILEAVAAGEVEVGITNHYYLYRYLAEDAAFPVANYYFGGGDPGALINIAGAGVVSTTDQPDAAMALMEYLLSAEAQSYFAEQTFEIPVVAGVDPHRSRPAVDRVVVAARVRPQPADRPAGHRRPAHGGRRPVTLAAVDAHRRARAARPRPVRIDAPLVGLLGLLVGAGAALPLGYLVWRAIELGWADSWEVLSSARTRELLVDTLGLVVAVTLASTAIAIPLAWLTTRTDLPGRRFWTIVTALPLAIPTYVGAFAMIGALGPRGIVQGWLEPLGVERIPSIYGFWGAFVVLTLFTYPYVLLPVRAAFRRLDPSLDEASRTLGRNPWTTFFRVVLPQVRPAAIAGALLVALYTLSDFGAVSMLRYDTFTRAIYVQYRGALNRNSAAVLGLVLVAITIAVLAGEQRFRGREQVHRLHSGGARVAPPVRLGRLRWVAAGACGLLSFIALVVPLAVIGYWLWRGVRVGEPLLPAWSLVRNSLLASALGAVVTMLAAWPIALLSVRHHGRFTRLVERLSWSGHALPGRGGRAGARVLRRPLRAVGVPDPRRCSSSPTWCCSCRRRSPRCGARWCRSPRRWRRRRSRSACPASRRSGASRSRSRGPASSLRSRWCSSPA
jgi:iron(III) transport system permease protein